MRRAVDRCLALSCVAAATLVIAVPTVRVLVVDPSPSPSLPRSNARHLAVFLSLLALFAASTLAASLTPPGSAADWPRLRPDTIFPADAPPPPPPALPRPPPPHWRACAACAAPKPPRVSHCRACDACTLRFDHHCGWLGACVGLRNHKPYLLLLVYGTLASAHAALLLARFLLHAHALRRLTPRRHPEAFAWALAAPLAAAAAAVAAVGLGALLAGQLRLAVRNETLVEALARRGAPYDAGPRLNLRHLLGPTPALWPLPVVEDRRGPAARRVARALQREGAACV